MAKPAMQCKELMVKEIFSRLSSSDTLIVTSFKGLTSQQMSELRKSLYKQKGEYFIVKDSMAKRALTKEPYNRIIDFFKGEVGVVINKQDDPTHVSKVLVKFSKDNGFLKILGGILEGNQISTDDVVNLSKLPSREALLGQLANVINSPIQGIASVLNGIICKLLYVLNTVKDKKDSTTEAQKDGDTEKKS